MFFKMVDSGRMRPAVFITLIVLIFTTNILHAFNIDVKSPYIYKDPFGSNTHFGYSLAFHRATTLIVGAPLSKVTNIGDGKQYGTVFECKGGTACTQLRQVDQVETFGKEKRDDQRMGATVYSNNDKILACAPRYKTVNEKLEEYLTGKCDVISIFDTSSSFVWRPTVSLTTRLPEFKYSQVGFSAKFIDSPIKELMTGLPNAQLGKGFIALAKGDGMSLSFTDTLIPKDYEYNGYATASGIFTKDKQSVFVVGGAPRGNNLDGKVFMYSVLNPNETFAVLNDPSKTVGSYFGSSLAAADVNNDQFSDLVVGAPYYEGDSYNEGTVYVYINNKQNGLEHVQTLYGNKKYGPLTGSLFGTALGSVGDLNQDQFSDIAIGAPYGGEDGKGIVYLYYGTANKEPLKLLQVITPSSLGAAGAALNGFGFAFADFLPFKNKLANDVDDNKYPDLAIGAYKSDQAVVLRSRPVITIMGELKTGSTKKIDLFSSESICNLTTDGKTKNKCIEGVQVCLTLAGLGIGTTNAEVEYKLALDTQQVIAKRAFLLNGQQQLNEITKVMTVSTAESCERYTVYLINNTRDIYRELELELTYNVKEPSSCINNLCPVANQILSLSDKKVIPYITGCSDDGNDECNSDLVVTLSTNEPLIRVGITEVLDVKAQITNKKENAFASYLHVQYPKELSPNQVKIEGYSGSIIWDPNVSQDSDINTLSITLSSPIKNKMIENVNIQFGVQLVQMGTKTLKLTAIVSTSSIEMNPQDNNATLIVKVSLSANLTVSGNVKPEQVKWTKEVSSPKIVGPKIVHTFFYQNMGPSSVDTSLIRIDFPEIYNKEYILNIIKVELEGTNSNFAVGTCTYGITNALNLNISESEQHLNQTKSRKRRDVLPSIQCGSSAVKCRLIECKINFLQKSDSVTVTVISTLVEATFDKTIKEGRKISAYTKFTTDAVAAASTTPQDFATVDLIINSPYLTKSGGKTTVAWWIILLCVLAAIIIISLIVFVMYKKGFFKRKNKVPTEEQSELRRGEPDEE